jgi:hypothetical protein
MFDPFRHFLHGSDNMVGGQRHLGRVVGNIPDAIWAAGGSSGIFPTQFWWGAASREGCREYSRPSLGGGRHLGRVVGNVPDPVWVGPDSSFGVGGQDIYNHTWYTTTKAREDVQCNVIQT